MCFNIITIQYLSYSENKELIDCCLLWQLFMHTHGDVSKLKIH